MWHFPDQPWSHGRSWSWRIIMWLLSPDMIGTAKILAERHILWPEGFSFSPPFNFHASDFRPWKTGWLARLWQTMVRFHLPFLLLFSLLFLLTLLLLLWISLYPSSPTPPILILMTVMSLIFLLRCLPPLHIGSGRQCHSSELKKLVRWSSIQWYLTYTAPVIRFPWLHGPHFTSN